MKKILFILCMLMCMCACTTTETTDSDTSTTEDSFQDAADFKLYPFKMIDFGPRYYLVYDPETKVEYVISRGGNSHCMIYMLYNADGTPKTYNK